MPPHYSVPVMKTLITNYGNGIAIGFEGESEEINRAFNRLFNWGAINQGDLHKMGDRFAYAITTESALFRAITAERLATWQDTPLSRTFKGERNNKRNAGKRFLVAAQDAARMEIAAFERENFLGRDSSTPSPYQELDGGAPFWVAETED